MSQIPNKIKCKIKECLNLLFKILTQPSLLLPARQRYSRGLRVSLSSMTLPDDRELAD